MENGGMVEVLRIRLGGFFLLTACRLLPFSIHPTSSFVNQSIHLSLILVPTSSLHPLVVFSLPLTDCHSSHLSLQYSHAAIQPYSHTATQPYIHTVLCKAAQGPVVYLISIIRGIFHIIQYTLTHIERPSQIARRCRFQSDSHPISSRTIKCKLDPLLLI